MAIDLREAFVGHVVELASALGPLSLGVVDPTFPGAAEGVSRLLTRSIEDARATVGGHLPDWLVEDIKRNYTSPEKVRTLWASRGHRFAVVGEGEIVATIHVAKDHDTIFTVNREVLNVSAREYPGFKPDRHHHVVNISVKHEVRRARVGTAMVDGIVQHFRSSFDGDGLWVRADPPWHPGLVGMGFVHDPRLDIFLPADVERTAGLPHADFNARYACDCAPASDERVRAMRDKKLQYVSLARSFGPVAPRAPVARRPIPVRSTPGSTDELATIVARAFSHRTPLAIRGRGFGSPPPTTPVVSTEKLTRVLAVSTERVTVEAGVSWEALLRALPRRVIPPVLTAWLPASVGGTLSTGGFGKGSHRHGFQIDHVVAMVVVTGDGRRVACSPREASWLFDGALGGLGELGVIAEATLALVPHPGFVRVTRRTVDDADALLAALDEETADRSAYHVTSFAEGGRWTIVTARESADGIPIADYVASPRDPTGDGSVLNHLFVPRRSLAAYLTSHHASSIQIVPVRQQRARHRSLFQSLDDETGELIYGVLSNTSSPLPSGATRSLAGAIPEDESDWRAHLGAFADDVVRVKKLADPGAILGSHLANV